MRAFLTAVGMATLLATASASAQDYPTKPVIMTMPFSAGGPGDALARVLAQAMTDLLKQQVLIENTGGAGGTLGSAKVARSSPDGYSLLITHISHATNVTLYRNLPYDALTAFEPIGLVAELPMTLVSKKDIPAKSFAELLAYIKANKDKISYAHAGIGSASHLCGLLLLKAIETPVATVPYKGTGPAMNDLLGGQVDLMCDQTANTLALIKAGSIKSYGVTSNERLPQLPDTPTLKEVGLPNFELSIWYGLYAPKGTPQPITEKLSATLQQALKDPKLKDRYTQLGATPVSSDKAQPGPLRERVESEIDKWSAIIKQAGAYAE